MKSVKILLIAALSSVLLFSCSKHDDTASSSNLIVGSWKIAAISYTGTSTTNVNGMKVNANFTGEGANMDMNLTFSENPDVYVAKGNYDIILHTTIEGQDYPTNYSDITFLGGGTWSENGNVVTITNQDGQTSKGKLQKMGDNALKITFDLTTTEMEAGIAVQLKMHGIYMLEK